MRSEIVSVVIGSFAGYGIASVIIAKVLQPWSDRRRALKRLEHNSRYGKNEK